MTNKFPYTLISVLFLCLSLHAQDQENQLPKLKKDPSFKSGELANGITWYFAENKTQKGLMNISLVQKMDSEICEKTLDSIAVANFNSIGALHIPVRDFLSRNGISAGEKGYHKAVKGSIRYDFNRLSSAHKDSVLDSTLLAVFNLAEIFGRSGAPSAGQAVVVAGDFDSKLMLSKMNLLSLIAPLADGKAPVLEFSRDSTKLVAQGFRIDRDGSLAKVSAVWNDSRTPAEYMETVLPVISDKLAGELGWVLKHRLEPVFDLNKVNAWTEFHHVNSAQSPYEDKISFTANCMGSDADLVEDIMAREFSRLLTWGIDQVEYAYARDAYRYSWYKSYSSQIVPNSEKQQACVSSFLYDASLATDAEKMKFAYRKMPLETQTELFNDFMQRLLVQTAVRDTTLSPLPYYTSKEEIDKILDGYIPSYSLKTPKEKLENTTGGLLWTYQNGVNLIHKKLETNGITHFTYAVRGGREEAEMEDVMSVSDIAPEALENYLSANGLDIKLKLNPSDIRISGTVVKENTELLLKLLSAFSNQEVNKEVLGPGNYKLLVIASDMEDAAISELVGRYAPGLRPGGKWMAGKAFEEDTDDAFDLKGFTLFESDFKFDLSATNKALAEIAAYALEDAVMEEFQNDALYMRNFSSFHGFPVGRYRLMFGVHRYAHNTVSGLGDPDAKEIRQRLEKVVRKLAEQPLDESQLKKYRGLAKNAYLSHSGTADFYVSLAVERYMDNKNFGSRYTNVIDSIKAASIQKFYASATDSDR